MGRCFGVSVLGTFLIITIAAPGVSLARQDVEDSVAPTPGRAYKPAERRQQEEATQAARRQAAAPKDDAAIPPNITDPEAYQKELDAARDQRDRDLKDAAKETDRRKFEKRKEQIFAQYAAILAEMRDKYTANPDAAKKTTPRTTKSSRPAVKPAVSERPGRPEVSKPAPRRKDSEVDVDVPAKTKTKSAKKRGADDATDTLEDAQKRLDDENGRHDGVMEQLNKDLSAAQASKNKQKIRKAERAIEKENNTYEAKKSLLESRVKELGGKIDRPASASVR